MPVCCRLFRSGSISPIAALETRPRKDACVWYREVEEHAVVGHVARCCVVLLRCAVVAVGKATVEISNNFLVDPGRRFAALFPRITLTPSHNDICIPFSSCQLIHSEADIMKPVSIRQAVFSVFGDQNHYQCPSRLTARDRTSSCVVETSLPYHSQLTANMADSSTLLRSFAAKRSLITDITFP
jgi:hypothetical protein